MPFEGRDPKSEYIVLLQYLWGANVAFHGGQVLSQTQGEAVVNIRLCNLDY